MNVRFRRFAAGWLSGVKSPNSDGADIIKTFGTPATLKHFKRLRLKKYMTESHLDLQ